MAAVAASPSPKAARLTLAILAVLAVLAFLVHVGYGSTGYLWPTDVLRELFSGRTGTNANNVVWLVRLTRALGCVLVGGILGAVGSAFQALFRNPLAEPYVVGVSSGAAIGGVAAILLGATGLWWGVGQLAFAFAGGILSLGLVIALASRRGATNVLTLLLAGVVVGSMLSGILSLFILGSGRDANQLLRWLLGNTYDVRWSGVWVLTAALAIGAPVLVLQSRALNAFAVGEETARRLGIDTRRLKTIVLVTGTAMTAAAVGATGVIPFLGLVAPHISRRLVGIDWRRSLVASILVGAVLLLFADVLTQRLIPALSVKLGYEAVVDLPVGVVTALIGAPSLLILLRKAR
jgi:iron complex transport system permease protein